MGEWIKVSERLPENLQKVLVCDIMGNIYTAICLRFENGKTDWASYATNVRPVTHWCSLPKPPEAEK